MKVIQGISGVLDQIAKWLATFATGAMWLVMCYCVVMRYVFHNAPVWGDELCRYCLVWLTFYGGAVALRRRSLANMNLLVNLIPPKARKWVNIAVSAISFVLLVAFVIWSIQLIQMRSVQIQKSPAMGLPMPIVYSCLPIGLGLMALQQLVLILVDIGADPESTEIADPREGAVE